MSASNSNFHFTSSIPKHNLPSNGNGRGRSSATGNTTNNITMNIPQIRINDETDDDNLCLHLSNMSIASEARNQMSINHK